MKERSAEAFTAELAETKQRDAAHERAMLETHNLGENKISVKEIDAAVRGTLGLRLAAAGPMRVLDFAGLDIHFAN